MGSLSTKRLAGTSFSMCTSTNFSTCRGELRQACARQVCVKSLALHTHVSTRKPLMIDRLVPAPLSYGPSRSFRRVLQRTFRQASPLPPNGQREREAPARKSFNGLLMRKRKNEYHSSTATYRSCHFSNKCKRLSTSMYLVTGISFST